MEYTGVLKLIQSLLHTDKQSFADREPLPCWCLKGEVDLLWNLSKFSLAMNVCGGELVKRAVLRIFQLFLWMCKAYAACQVYS